MTGLMFLGCIKWKLSVSRTSTFVRKGLSFHPSLRSWFLRWYYSSQLLHRKTPRPEDAGFTHIYVSFLLYITFSIARPSDICWTRRMSASVKMVNEITRNHATNWNPLSSSSFFIRIFYLFLCNARAIPGDKWIFNIGLCRMDSVIWCHLYMKDWSEYFKGKKITVMGLVVLGNPRFSDIRSLPRSLPSSTETPYGFPTPSF